ncbi:CocE/NonD family hydrolase [Nocardioides marmorisolisilvae]|uniref:CocE/NonD family hydrolase n=1 Tax=Nocardioides marmorisolisilvae TaxID=1542737 RepID=A0A3N0DVB6_9ACTN|nr:CocE/NonD family hydrolase [Nocardioides marmorisolisilvae]RNL79562.1 CocE/NonD family hydrolase [Nocardioides marmorisolisilvae]
MLSTRRTLAGLVAAGVSLTAALLPMSSGSAATGDQKLRVTTSDGTSLAATLTTAGVDTPRPTVVEFTPYGESGATYSFSSDYNFLAVQDRGTGDSDGSFDVLGPKAQQDVVDVLRWACQQPWSNGALAIAGFSASSIVIFNSMHQELPCVKAAVLRSGTFELYRDLLVPGGIPNSVPGLAVLGAIGAPALAQGQERMTRNPSSALDVIIGLVTAGFDAGLLNPTLDDYWVQRGFRGNVNHFPVLMLDGTFDVEPRGDYQAFQYFRDQGIDTRLLVTGAHDGAPRGTDYGLGAINQWFDHYVRGIDNGVQNEPRVEILAADGSREALSEGQFVHLTGSDWPLPGTTWTSLSLSKTKAKGVASLNNGTLTRGAPDLLPSLQAYPAATSFPLATDPNTIATVAGGDGGPLNKLTDFIPALSDMNLTNLTGLTYTTGALQSAVTAVGPATLDLKLSSTLPSTQIWAVISDVAPNGESKPMAVGRLNTAFPDIIPTKSLYAGGQLVQPYGDYSHTSLALPLQARNYHVEFWPIANRFEAGHRIQLSLVGQSALSFPTLPSLNTVTIGGGSGSRLMFPTAPGSSLAAALP